MSSPDPQAYTKDEVDAIIHREVLTHRVTRVEKDLDTHIPALYKDVEEIKSTVNQMDKSLTRTNARISGAAAVTIVALGILQWIIATWVK